ncbi:YheC/YheD family endospore coat-associated protein [Natronincola ferrireducens]|uniref:YheC/D like ATP-grasp n=1 Tax=Natronincola ferrireducens TaxID=393762 RepID=A0A1G9CS94_9FIRM|nr:YheC/YheD family protein [Natronincola ferrireducens]SDK54498.1 YheC/D like ATP-grasp [Natronincola ferrireducens]
MYSIVIDNKIAKNTIYINAQSLKKNNIKCDKIILHFGLLEKELIISVNNHIEPLTIIIPQKLTEEIYIPNLPYESYFQENHLVLGPVIGYLIASNYRMQDSTTLCFGNYDKIKGLIFIFQEKAINKRSKTIQGYYYNERTKTFVKGVFPYPRAVYVRKYIKRGTFEHLRKHMGDKIFNYPYNIDKLSMWQMLSKDTELIDHLPKTITYTDIEKLFETLKLYNEVYLKPFNKSRGRGILYLKKFKNWYILKDEFSRRLTIKTKIDLEKILQKKLNKNTIYLIQEAIPFQDGNNKVDFRVYIQKDHTKEWKYSGMETKIANKGSIISNSRNREKVIPGERALKEIFHLDVNKVDLIINEIAQLCTKALEIIENNNYHIGDAAIDLIIDKDLKIWLLEVQLNYARLKKAKRTEDEALILPAILPTPFEYAKALTEF